MNTKIPPSLPLSREEKSPLDKGDLGDLFSVAVKAATSAGAILQECYGQNHNINTKADKTLVSEADLSAEKTILDVIQKNFPEHSIFSEESGMHKQDSEYLWIVDPLDGSTNFLQNLHHFAVAIALVKDDEPVLGVIYHPLTEELFSAETGQGAALNGEPLQPSTATNLSRAVIHFGRSHINTARHADLYRAVMSRARTLRIFGSIALGCAYTAAGRFAAHVHTDSKLYDVIAGAVIAKSAGLKVTDFSGKDWKPDISDPESASDIVISTSGIHDQLIAILR